MKNSDLDTAHDVGVSTRDRPAVGLAVSPTTSSNAVAGAILRAQRHGHQVFVAHAGPTNDEAIQFARDLDATVIESGAKRTNGASVHTDVTRAARTAGFPGVIWHDDPTQRVDFERSVTAVEEHSEYAIDARYQPVVAPEPAVIVAIPAHNEERTISEVVSQAHPHADEVLVIDDGSDDETAARAADAGATVIEHVTNRGYGATLKTAFCEADRSRAECLVVVDGDGQHDPTDIPRLLETQQEQAADIVIGCRFGEGAETDIPFYRRVGLAVVTVLTNLSLGVVRPRSLVTDPQSGFRAYSRDAITSLAAAEGISDHMGASTDILHHAHEHDFEIAEVGATVRYDVENRSNRNPVQHGVTLVMNLVRTIERQRPISALGIPGFISAFIGLGFGYWTFHNYIQTGVFPLGLAILSSFFALAGILAAFTAIILHSLSTQLPD